MNNNLINKIAASLVVIGGVLSFTKHKKLALGAIGTGLLGLIYQLFSARKRNF